jgi:hypothetical protein
MFTNFFRPLFLTFLGLFFVQFSYSQTMIYYALASSWSSTATSPASTNTGTFSTDALSPGFASSWAYATGWDSNSSLKSWASTPISTIGYYNVYVTAYLKSEIAGPKNFQLQYKIGSGGIWRAAANYTITTPNYSTKCTTTLPDSASNQSSVYIRWHEINNKAISGSTVSATAKSFINLVNVTAVQFLYPQVQSSNILIIARTSKTITVSWTKGGAEPQLLMMNTVNDFTPLPINDQTFTPIIGPYTSGRQVIYNTTDGNATATFTITVPSATDEYWFRVFDYQYNNGHERYGVNETATPVTNTENPKQCILEEITLNPALYGLITGNLSATITAPEKSTIVERGIYYSLSPNFTVGDPGAMFLGNDYNDQTGTFNFSDYLYTSDYSGYLRGQTIYYKAYVTNQSGTIYTDEMSFNNTPVFTGSGNWETASLWNVKEVPGSAGNLVYHSNGDVTDSPIINGVCTQTVSNSVTDLTINSGKKLIVSSGTIDTGNKLNVQGTLTNNSDASGILIKSDKGKANGSLIWASGNPTGTVEMWSKSYTDSKYHWQYFGIPVTGINANVPFSGSGVRVRKYNEANHDATGNDIGLWLPSANGATMATTNDPMYPVVGYEVTQPKEGKFTFSGTLNHNDVINYSLGYTSGADWQGNNIIANPFVSAIDISKITLTNTDGSVYLYNAGSRDDWTANSGISSDGESPGQYTASNGAFAGNLGTPKEISSMQGFLVKATSSNAKISIPYTATIVNTKTQRAPQTKESAIVGTRIDVTGTDYSDKMWIFTADNCSKNYDCGYDAVKLLGSVSTPQIYATETAGDYQIDAVNDMNNTLLSFMPGSETNLKLKFTHQNLESKYSSVYLVDLLENKTIDVTTSGTEYTFSATSSPTPTSRFKIITTPLVTTGINTLNKDLNFKIFSSNSSLFVENESGKSGNVIVYNMAGVAVRQAILPSNGITTLSNLESGAYVAKATIGSDLLTERLIIR